MVYTNATGPPITCNARDMAVVSQGASRLLWATRLALGAVGLFWGGGGGRGWRERGEGVEGGETLTPFRFTAGWGALKPNATLLTKYRKVNHRFNCMHVVLHGWSTVQLLSFKEQAFSEVLLIIDWGKKQPSIPWYSHTPLYEGTVYLRQCPTMLEVLMSNHAPISLNLTLSLRSWKTTFSQPEMYKWGSENW